jgi:hypothetical protein
LGVVVIRNEQTGQGVVVRTIGKGYQRTD